MTYDDIVKANQELNGIDFKGKNYVMVNKRVQGFRKILPGGTITTEIISLDDEKVVMQARIYDGEQLLATGTAYELQASSFINKTSYIENCETSAVGRALGFLGIGIDDNVASAEELANAIKQQNEQPINETQKQTLLRMCKDKNLDPDATFPKGLDGFTVTQYLDAVERLVRCKVRES